MKSSRILVIACFVLAIGSAFTTNRVNRFANPTGYFSTTLSGETNASDCATSNNGAACTINPDGNGPYSPVYDTQAHIGNNAFKLKRVNP